MKRYIAVTLIFTLVVGISAFMFFDASASNSKPYVFSDDAFDVSANSLYPHAFNEVVYLPASLLFFETTFEGLESRAIHIVRGRIKDDAYMNLRHDNAFRPESVTSGNNIVSLEIYEVFQGDLNAGDVIRIIEPYWIEDGTLFTLGNYMPSIPNEEYIFFLYHQVSRSEPDVLYGAFPVIHGDRGRYRVPSASGIQQADIQIFSEHDSSAQDLIMGHLSVGTSGSMELYTYLWNEVMNAFLE